MAKKGRKKKRKKEETHKPGENERTADSMIDESEESEEDYEESREVTSLMPLGESGPLERISPLQQYLNTVKVHPLLSREEESDLAVRLYEKGDMLAAERLVLGNLRLVVKIALEYNRHWQDLLDLIQEGNLGLVQAVKKFDPYRETRFSTYASFWIRAYILKFLMENYRLIKIGTTQAQRRLFFNLRKEKDRLEAFGFKPAPAMLAKSLDVKESEVMEMERRLAGTEDSLEKPVTEDGEQTLEAVLADQGPGVDTLLAEEEFEGMVRDKLKEFRETLKGPDRKKEAFIFDRRIMSEEPLTLKEVGDHFSVSRERVRQIESRLLKKLREFLQEELPEFDATDFLARE